MIYNRTWKKKYFPKVTVSETHDRSLATILDGKETVWNFQNIVSGYVKAHLQSSRKAFKQLKLRHLERVAFHRN